MFIYVYVCMCVYTVESILLILDTLAGESSVAIVIGEWEGHRTQIYHSYHNRAAVV